jgi:general L-amino acid transport system permease protein
MFGYPGLQIGLALAVVGGLAGMVLATDRSLRGVCAEILTLALVAMLGAYLVHNTIVNLAARKIANGYAFLGHESRFEISETLISYSAASTYGRALLVGILNTLKVSILGIVLATVIGISIGMLSLSRNILVASLAAIYVNFLRNIPVLLHIILWYTALTLLLPPLRQALSPLPGIFLSQRGLFYPVPEPALGWTLAVLAVPLAIAGAWALSRWARVRRDATGQGFPTLWAAGALALGLPLLGWLIGGAPLAISVPELKGFNFVGGDSVSPEFAAVLVALTIYTSAFIAEITRSGIMAVPHGQSEAGRSLGLPEGVVVNQVILPQALRVIIPPLTNQYLNLTKNSSLSVAVGYPDLVSVANTTLNQTGQAIEAISIIMLVYLSTSLLTSAIMNAYNRRIQLVER